MLINVSLYFLILSMVLQQISGNTKWPAGSYGLPRPTTGCPEYWKEGYRYHDTEDEHNNNRHSKSYHLSGRINKHGIRQEFCMKEESLFEEVDYKWPDGQYCIYKYGEECPEGLKEGWVYWDDENQEDLDGGNSVSGSTPDGVYELDTLMYFCCNDNGNASTPIDLPLNNPFYMMPFKTKECQKVNNIKNVNSEFIHWDDEDRGNRNTHSKFTPYGLELDAWDTMIYYCYYDTGICGKHGTMCSNVTIDIVNDKSAIDSNHLRKPTASILKQRDNSAFAVIIGCSVAGVIVCAAVTSVLVRHILKKNVEKYNDLYNIEASEDSLPLPDHIW